MKALFKQQAQRIDTLSLRERAIMFVSIAVALVAAADALVISPRLAEQKALLAQRQAQTVQINSLRSTLAGGAQADTPAARLAREVAQARARQQALDAQIAAHLSHGAQGAHLPDLLERVLKRDEHLTLLRLSSAVPRANPLAGDAQGGPGQPLLALPQHSVDIELRGSYTHLAQYVADTERALPALRWGALSITAGGGAPVLSARVYLLGDSP